MGSENAIPEIVLEEDTPFGLGVAIGKEMQESVHKRLKNDKILYSNLLPFCKTETGSEILRKMDETNKKRYPRYYAELQGIAEGSGVPFVDLFVLNLRKEIGAFIPEESPREMAMAADQCSDLLFCDEQIAMVAHNEDADSSVYGHAFFLTVKRANGFSFTAYTYAGEMPSCAFGFNQHGIAFSLNAVPPKPSEVSADGIARNFISRDLLEASSMADALSRITDVNVCFGHNYNIMDFRSREITTLEVASNYRHNVLPISSTPYFHANNYSRLNVSQKLNESSIHRMTRAAELLKEFRQNKEFFLQVLGDTKDGNFPIYMSPTENEKPGLHIVTLCTAVFNLDKKEILIFEQNPKLQILVKTFHLM